MSSLQQEIEQKRAEIQTDAYSISVGEWISIYEKHEIDIHPEFQRYFRWSNLQKTKLIESILLGIPIPPIFVAQRSDGVWDVVDGLQRLSTIYQFVGILQNEEGTSVPKLVLDKTKDLPSLEGKVWEDESNEEISFTNAQRLFIKRAKIGVSIILASSDARSKYELFQRLNTGGSSLTDQELRNSMLASLDRDLYQRLRVLSDYQNFRFCIPLTDRQISEQYHVELVLRFILLRILPASDLTTQGIGDISDFLTNHMVDMANNSNFDFNEEEIAFQTTFDILASTTEENSFKRYDSNRDKFTGQFLITPFEVVALGIGFNYQKWDTYDTEDILSRIKALWFNKDIINNTGSGVRANSRLAKTIQYGRELFSR